MAKVERALIVGAGIGGLAAYTSLAQAGIEADVIERADGVNVYGVGICQPANSLRMLKRLGVLEEILDIGWAFDDWLFFDHRGKPGRSRCPRCSGRAKTASRPRSG